MDAAADIFLKLGFAGASVEAIAERAGVTRQTIYNRFQSKDGLFCAICRASADDFIAPIAEIARSDGDLRAKLDAIGEATLKTALSAKSLAFYRMIINEAARLPELGRALYAAGPARAIEELAAYFRAEAERGRLDFPCPVRAAEHYAALLTGQARLRALMGVGPKATPARRRQWAEEATELFLRAYAR